MDREVLIEIGVEELPAGTVLSVTALTELIKGRLEPAFSDVWVTGEISNYKVYGSGHAYFSIKDEGQGDVLRNH